MSFVANLTAIRSRVFTLSFRQFKSLATKCPYPRKKKFCMLSMPGSYQFPPPRPARVSPVDRGGNGHHDYYNNYARYTYAAAMPLSYYGE